MLRKKYKNKTKPCSSWEESSGFIAFLSSIPNEIEKFNNSFGFEIKYSAIPPLEIDGSRDVTRNVGFVVIRENKLLPERTYCIYSLLHQKILYGYVGVYQRGSIKTFRLLEPIVNFKKSKWTFYDWLRELVKISYEKYL